MGINSPDYYDEPEPSQENPSSINWIKNHPLYSWKQPDWKTFFDDTVNNDIPISELALQRFSTEEIAEAISRIRVAAANGEELGYVQVFEGGESTPQTGRGKFYVICDDERLSPNRGIHVIHQSEA